MKEINIRLNRVKSYKGKFNNEVDVKQGIKANPELKEDIMYLAKHLLNKPVTGCSNCIADTFLQLVNISNNNIKKMEKDKAFIVKNGAVIYSIDGDPAKTMSVLNTSYDLALYHLATQRDTVEKYFSKVPDNLDELIEDYKKKQGIVITQSTKTPKETVIVEDNGSKTENDTNSNKKGSVSDNGDSANGESSEADKAGEAEADKAGEAEAKVATAGSTGSDEDATGAEADPYQDVKNDIVSMLREEATEDEIIDKWYQVSIKDKKLTKTLIREFISSASL